MRNVVVAMGNAPFSQDIVYALDGRLGIDDNLDDHIEWAIETQISKTPVKDRKKERLIRIIQKGIPRDA
jgi:epoxyqueuosine reductase